MPSAFRKQVVTDADDDVGLVLLYVLGQPCPVEVAVVEVSRLVKARPEERLHGVGVAVAPEQQAGQLRPVRVYNRLAHVSTHVDAVGDELALGRDGEHLRLHGNAVVRSGERYLLRQVRDHQPLIRAVEAEELAVQRAEHRVRQLLKGELGLGINSQVKARGSVHSVHERGVGGEHAAMAVMVVGVQIVLARAALGGVGLPRINETQPGGGHGLLEGGGHGVQICGVVVHVLGVVVAEV